MIFSVPEHSPLAELSLDSALVRPTDWGLRGWRRSWFLARRAHDVVRKAGSDDVVVLTTCGVEAVVAPLLRRKCRLVLWDVLTPNHKLLRAAARLAYRRADVVAVIRRGDEHLMRREFRVGRVAFVPFPTTVFDVPVSDGEYVYAAGTAHRDWKTFERAVEIAGVRAVVATNADVTGVENVGHLSPSSGRVLLAGCSVVAVPIEDTMLPAGPLVILDALAAGKPVVATDVNGTRDYVQDGLTGYLVAPGDARGMAERLASLLADADTRGRMGEAALKLADSLSWSRVAVMLRDLS
jgi:glycosyltransferase involved in cell wall biosynthesis